MDQEDLQHHLFHPTLVHRPSHLCHLCQVAQAVCKVPLGDSDEGAHMSDIRGFVSFLTAGKCSQEKAKERYEQDHCFKVLLRMYSKRLKDLGQEPA